MTIVNSARVARWAAVGLLISAFACERGAKPDVSPGNSTPLLKVEIGDDVKIQIQETARDARTSTVRVTQNRHGSPTADTLLGVHGFAKFAAARGASYFTNLKEWPEPSGAWMYVLGFSDSDRVNIQDFFGSQYAQPNQNGQAFLCAQDWNEEWNRAQESK